MTVFAADKLSDIVGLRRGIDRYGRRSRSRMGTTVACAWPATTASRLS